MYYFPAVYTILNTKHSVCEPFTADVHVNCISPVNLKNEIHVCAKEFNMRRTTR